MRSLSAVCGLGLCAAVATGWAGVPTALIAPDDSTVLLWHLDEGEGEMAADASPAGAFVGKIRGAEWVDGKFGKALHWDEGNGNVSVQGDFSAITDQFTLEAWVKLDTQPSGKEPFWAFDIAGKLFPFVMTIRPPGVLYVGVQLGEQRNWLHGQTQIPIGEWTHLALVYDGPAGRIGTFVNGEIDKEFDVGPGVGDVSISDNPFWIRSYAGGNEKLIGAIDEVCLSSRAKTFGHEWQSYVFLHTLRYSSELLLGLCVVPNAPNPPRSFELAISDGRGTEVVSATLNAQQVAAGAVIPAQELQAGEYHAKVVATRADGTRETMLEREMRYTPPEKDLVDIRPDGVLLVEGEPMFPIMAYHVRQKDLKLVREAGFNIAAAFTTTYPPGWERESDGVGYMEKCGEAGILGVGLGGGIRTNAEAAQATLTHYRGSRDLAMYYLDDEPHGPGRQPEDITRLYEQWAAWDPTHPMFLLHNRPAEFARYAPACDIFATDSYPVRREDDPPLRRVAIWTKAAVDAVFGRKAVWIALQCYTVKAVSEKGKGRDGVPRLPTEEELRCMSYLALAEGARGLLWYAFDDTYYDNGAIRGVNIAEEFPEFWETLKRVIAEIAAHQGIWTYPYADLHPESANEELVVQRRPYLKDGVAHMLVVNPTQEEQAVRLQLEEVADTEEVRDALGGSPGRLAGGTLTDTLEPRQAKCYLVPLN